MERFFQKMKVDKPFERNNVRNLSLPERAAY